MSVFLKILRCILCCEEDRHDEDSLIQNPYFSGTPGYDYHPIRQPYPGSKIGVDNSKRTYSSQLIPTRKHPETSSASASSILQPRVVVDSGFSIKQESVKRIFEKPNEVSQKVKFPSPPLSLPPKIAEVKPVGSNTNKSSNQGVDSNTNKSSNQGVDLNAKFPRLILSETLIQFLSKPLQSSSEPPPNFSLPSSLSAKPPPSSSKLTIPLQALSIPANQQAKTNYLRVEKGKSPVSVIPKGVEDLIKKDSVPKVVNKPLSPCSLNPSSSVKSSSSLNPPPHSSKQVLSLAPPVSTNQQGKTNYVWVQKGTSPVYAIPKGVEDLIKKDSVPKVVNKPLSPCSLNPSSSVKSSSSLNPPPHSSKQILSLAPPVSTNQQGKTNYVWIQKGTSPVYAIPKGVEDLIKKDIVPDVLKKPLSPSTYRDYFAALLYAEDFYIEKWSGFELNNVPLKLQEAALYKKTEKNKYLNEIDEKDDKIFAEFEMDSVPERRPFLLSRDFVFVRPLGTKIEPFQGIIYRVVKSTRILVEFGKDFYSQHYPTCRYDVSFSFNRFCLKRSHQAVEAASDPLFQSFLFPNSVPRNNILASSTSHSSTHEAILQITGHKGAPPYLVEGRPLDTVNANGVRFVQAAVLYIYRTSPKCRILVCAPSNRTCDFLMRSLKEIPESDMFRANAAFRERDGVPDDILPSCLYKGECFVCPSFQELCNFKVIISTFVTSFRLHGEGISAGHFSHIFLVDASSTTEPETMITLANLANEKTAVVVTGKRGQRTGWVRSDIARKNGLQVSYFERLFESKLYKSSDSISITL